jgi:hypothetical protein
VSRPKNGKNSTKNGKNAKNPLLQTKILKLLYGPIFTIWAQIFFFFFFLKMSSDSFKSTYKRKKRKTIIFDVKLLTTNCTTVHSGFMLVDGT